LRAYTAGIIGILNPLLLSRETSILDTQEAWKAWMLAKGWAPGEPFRTLET